MGNIGVGSGGAPSADDSQFSIGSTPETDTTEIEPGDTSTVEPSKKAVGELDQKTSEVSSESLPSEETAGASSRKIKGKVSDVVPDEPEVKKAAALASPVICDFAEQEPSEEKTREEISVRAILASGEEVEESSSKDEVAFSVRTDSAEMKQIDKYSRGKVKLLAKAKKRVSATLPKQVNPMQMIQENVYGTPEELKGAKMSDLELSYQIDELASLEEEKNRLKETLNNLRGALVKLETKKMAHEEGESETIDSSIDATQERVEEHAAQLREVEQKIQDLRTGKSERTEKVIDRLKDPVSGQGGMKFTLRLDTLHGTKGTGEIQGMYFGAKDKDGNITEFDPSEKTIIIMTGSGDRAENYASPMVEELQSQGYQTVIFNYMGFGESTGEMSEWGLYASGESVYQYITSAEGLGVPEENVTLLGYSLGGYVAAETAKNHPHVSGAVFDRTYTSGADVADKYMGKMLGKPARKIFRKSFGELNTTKKMDRIDSSVKIAIFDDEEELADKSPNFGHRAKGGGWELKRQFQKYENVEYNVLEGKGHYHPSTGVWFSEDNPETAPDARSALYDFLGKPNHRT